MSCWVKLTRLQDDPTFLNMDHAREIVQITNDHRGVFTLVAFPDDVIRVKETPEQIFQAMSQNAIYPWASLPGSVFVPGGLPAGNGGG